MGGGELQPPVDIRLDDRLYASLLQHLLPPGSPYEEAAFLFADVHDDNTFVVRDWAPIAADEFHHRSPYYLELADDTRARVIKRAHDLGASLVEVHSHPCYHAVFSESDIAGFHEFVPHVMWRLKSRPYMAIVFSPGAFDGLVWLDAPDRPAALGHIVIGDLKLAPTGLSLARWEVPSE